MTEKKCLLPEVRRQKKRREVERRGDTRRTEKRLVVVRNNQERREEERKEEPGGQKPPLSLPSDPSNAGGLNFTCGIEVKFMTPTAEWSMTAPAAPSPHADIQPQPPGSPGHPHRVE